MPRGSAQAPETEGDTELSQILSKDSEHHVGEAISILFLIATAIYASNAHGCYTKISHSITVLGVGW